MISQFKPLDARRKGQLPRRVAYFRHPWLCLAAGILALHLGPNGAQATDHVDAQTAAQAFDATVRESSFDLGWRFHRGSLPGAESPDFDDSGWRQLDVPHDWRIEDLPYATSDDGGCDRQLVRVRVHHEAVA
jgi:hypothetical protein